MDVYMVMRDRVVTPENIV